MAALSTGTKIDFGAFNLHIQLLSPVLTQVLSEELLLNVLEKRFYFQPLGESFLVHARNSSFVTLGFIEIIFSMLNSEPISVSLLHLFKFIDISSQELRPLRVFTI